jgi:hypothetical protein
LSLVDPLFTQEVAEVAAMGANKYDRDNWFKGQTYETVLDSMKRHLTAFETGEATDHESKLSHLAHVACNVMFLMYYERHPEKYGKYDNRMYHKEIRNEDEVQ